MAEEKDKSTIQLFVRFKVKRKDGSIKFDSGQRKANCFVLQFLQLICGYFKADAVTIKDVTGTNRTAPDAVHRSPWICSQITAPSGDSSYGIVVGTGTAAEANDNYALQSQCTHGTGANQFLHGSMGLTEPKVAAGNVDYVLERSFTNESGSAITVNEVGAYVKVWDSTATYRYFCILRDLTGGISVGNGEILVVEYTVRTTV